MIKRFYIWGDGAPIRFAIDCGAIPIAGCDEITTGTIMPVRDLIPIAIARYPHGPTRSQECASAPCERVRLPQD